MAKLKDIADTIDGRLRKFCGELTPEKRLTIILSWLILFGGLSIYITFSSIYRMGQKSVTPLTPDTSVEKVECLDENMEYNKSFDEYEYE